MAKVHGMPGEWARVKGTVAGLWPMFLGVGVLGFSIAIAVFVDFIIGALLSVAVSIFVIWSNARGLKMLKRFYKGARGEERVSAILSSLPGTYHVFNDFLALSSHVDHVVVGPEGVFAIETKYWAGTVTLDDEFILLNGDMPERSPLSQVLKEAKTVKSELKNLGWNGDVTPILAFASDTFEPRRAEKSGVLIINASELLDVFDSRREVMESEELNRLVSLMEHKS
jgi:hypothetical protein